MRTKMGMVGVLGMMLLACCAQGQLERIGFVHPEAPAPKAPTAKQIADNKARLWTLARDPFRVIEGKTNSVLAKGFVTFSGKVVGVSGEGIYMSGFYNEFGTYGSLEERDFFVAHFAYQVAEGDLIGADLGPRGLLMAKVAGTHQYTTAIGGSRTIHRLDYGMRCGPPPAAPRPVPAVASPKGSGTNAVAGKMAGSK